MAQDTNIIATMTNLADSGQDEFIQDWAEYSKIQLYEQGVSHKFINSDQSEYIIAKMITDLIEDGDLSKTSLAIIATLRANHPHTEDTEVQDV